MLFQVNRMNCIMATKTSLQLLFTSVRIPLVTRSVPLRSSRRVVPIESPEEGFRSFLEFIVPLSVFIFFVFEFCCWSFCIVGCFTPKDILRSYSHFLVTYNVMHSLKFCQWCPRCILVWCNETRNSGSCINWTNVYRWNTLTAEWFDSRCEQSVMSVSYLDCCVSIELVYSSLNFKLCSSVVRDFDWIFLWSVCPFCISHLDLNRVLWPIYISLFLLNVFQLCCGIINFQVFASEQMYFSALKCKKIISLLMYDYST